MATPVAEQLHELGLVSLHKPEIWQYPGNPESRKREWMYPVPPLMLLLKKQVGGTWLTHNTCLPSCQTADWPAPQLVIESDGTTYYLSQGEDTNPRVWLRVSWISTPGVERTLAAGRYDFQKRGGGRIRLSREDISEELLVSDLPNLLRPVVPRGYDVRAGEVTPIFREYALEAKVSS